MKKANCKVKMGLMYACVIVKYVVVMLGKGVEFVGKQIELRGGRCLLFLNDAMF